MLRRERPSPTENGPTAKRRAALEITTDLRPPLINRAELCHRIERDTGAVAGLVHAANATVFDHKLLGHAAIHQRGEFDQEVAALAATRTEWKIVGKRERHSWDS